MKQVLFLSLFIIICSNTFSQHQSNFELIGQSSDGIVYAVKQFDDLLLVSSGATLKILDVTNPLSPVQLSQIIAIDFITNFDIKGNILYITFSGVNSGGSHGLFAYDISNIYSPVFIDEYFREWNIRDFRSAGQYGYLCSPGQLDVLDLSSPYQQPVVLKTVFPASEEFDIYNKDDLLFVQNANNIQIFDLDTAPNIKLLSAINIYSGWNFKTNLFFENNILYAFDTSEGLKIFDLSNPGLPVFISNYDIKSSSFTKLNNDLIIQQNDQTLILDVSDVNKAVVKGRDFSIQDHKFYGAIGDYIIASGYHEGLSFFELDENSQLNSVYHKDIIANYSNFTVYNDLAFIGDENLGLFIYDILSKSNPVYLSSLMMPFNAVKTSPAVTENYCYTVSVHNGIQVIDISDLSNPEFVKNIFSETSFEYTKIYNGYLISSSHDKILISDISNPSDPALISTIETISNFGKFLFYNDKLITINFGINIYDITDVSKPELLSGFPMDDGIIDAAGYKDYLFLSSGRGGSAFIVDISDPNNPSLVNSPDFINGAWSFEIFNDLLYTFNPGYEGIYVWDISSPLQPKFVEIMNVVSPLYLYESDDNIYVNNWHNLFIYKNNYNVTNIEGDNEIIEGFTLSQNYPNPFNPSTTITYSIPKQSFVTLKVYDILGREISVLVNEEKQQGEYKVQFDAEGLSGGVYFYQLKADNFTQSKKMSLLR